MGIADDNRVDLRTAAGGHLLHVPQIYGVWFDGGSGQELSLFQALSFDFFPLHLQRKPFFFGLGEIFFHLR